MQRDFEGVERQLERWENKEHMMKFRHLRYFVAVAEELNFTHAAERLNMAQPPLSQQTKQMEDDLGKILIERGSRPMRLTRAGGAMLEHATRIW